MEVTTEKRKDSNVRISTATSKQIREAKLEIARNSNDIPSNDKVLQIALAALRAMQYRLPGGANATTN